MSFSVGYGVELGHLVDIYEMIGPGVIGQVDLDRRIHRNQTLSELGKMSFGILSTFFNRLDRYYHVNVERLKNDFYSLIVKEGEDYDVKKIGTPVVEREPMSDLREYREKFYRQAFPKAAAANHDGWWKKMFKR